MIRDLVFALLLIPAVVAADDAVVLTLDQAVDLALERSFEARTLRLDLYRAEQNAEAARGRFKSFADLEFRTPSYDQRFFEKPVPGQPSVFEQTEAFEWEGSLSLNQPLPTDGLITLSSSLRLLQQQTFLEVEDTEFEDNRFFTSMRLGISQPLFVPNELALGRERAELELDRARMRFTRTELDVIYRVTEGFFSLFRAQQQLEIARSTRDQQLESSDLAQRKYEAGLIPEVEALQMQVDLARSESELLQARGTLVRARDSFLLTVGLAMEESVEVRASVSVPEVEIDPDFALEHALEHRNEIREGRIDERLAEITLKQTDARRTVRGELRGFYDISGISDDALRDSGSVPDLLDSSFDDLRERPDNRGVSLSLSVPLWDSGVNAAEVAAAEATLERQELDAAEARRRVVRDVRSTLARVRESRQRLDVLQRSETVAERSYEISRARFDNGEITSQDLALDRDRLVQARQATLDASIQLRLALADLARQTLFDFEDRRSLVGEG
ncbi:MAG TPA: TolC family protein [Candidatus Krumholzibacteria bacterium]|nr:TolC family protein [Candidatus Krumholzibacteria bacterium]